jgi:uncharacterized protein (DUF58 family)
VLTRSGWGTTAAVAALAAAGRVFGFLELVVLAAGLGAVLLVALTLVRLRPAPIEVRRDLSPARVHAGQPAHVRLEVLAVGRRRTPLLELRDPVTATHGAHLRLAPLRPGESVQATYRLPTARRGVVEVGPLTVTRRDPFGMAQSSRPAAGVARLVVYPRIDAVPPLWWTTGSRIMPGLDQGTPRAERGDEFHALRPYVVGDDLRRVHWPSTARHDQLMVRQDRHAELGRLTVVLDVDRATMPEPALDEATAIAASVLAAGRRHGDLVRLVTGDGTDSGFVRDPAGLDAALEYLALVRTTRDAPLAGAVQLAVAHEAPGAVVSVTGPLGPTVRRALDRVGASGAAMTSVEVDPSCWDPNAPTPATVPTTRRMVVHRDSSFAEVWTAAVSGRGRLDAGAAR